MATTRIISIGRQFGAGGREIGKKLAETLNIPFYDKEMLAQLARQSGISDKFLKYLDEVQTPSLLYSFVMNTQSANFLGTNRSLDMMAYEAQLAAVKNAAMRGPCVIVGRGADYILRDDYEVFSVFITGDLEYRIMRVMKRDNVSEKEAAHKIARMDKSRASYYNELSDKKWGVAQSYDLCLNAGKIGQDNSMNLILQYLSLTEPQKNK